MQATWKAPVVEDEEGEGGARPQGSKKPSHQSTNATGERSPERREHSSWMWTAFKCRTYLFKCKCRGCTTPPLHEQKWYVVKRLLLFPGSPGHEERVWRWGLFLQTLQTSSQICLCLYYSHTFVMFLSVQLVGFWKNIVRTCVSYTRENRNTLCVVVFLGGFMSELFMKGNKSEMWRVKEYLKPCSNNQCAFKKTSLAPNCTNRDSMCQSYIFLFDFQDVLLHSHLPKQTHEYCFWPWNDSVLYL